MNCIHITLALSAINSPLSHPHPYIATVMSTKSQYTHRRGRTSLCSSPVHINKKCVFGLTQKANSELTLLMSFTSELQTFGAITWNVRLYAALHVRHTDKRSIGKPQSLGVVGLHPCTGGNASQQSYGEVETMLMSLSVSYCCCFGSIR